MTDAATPAVAAATEGDSPSALSAAREAFAASRRLRPLEVVFWLAVAGGVLAFPRHYLLINEMAILGLFALSLDVILGYAGIVSLGHGAYFGLGAYTAALVAKFVHPDPLLGLAAAMAASGLLALIASPLILRGSDLTRIMVTLGVASILYELANRMAWLTGGTDGLQGVETGPLFGLFTFDMAGRTACLYSLGLLFIVFLVLRRVVNAPLGLAWQAIRDNRLRAAAVGIPVNLRLATACALSGTLAGAAGALLAQTTAFASLDVLAFHRSADVLLVLVIGGAGYLYGGMVGAAVFTLLHDRLSEITAQYWQFWLGLALVLIVLMGQQRLVRPWTWFRRAQKVPGP